MQTNKRRCNGGVRAHNVTQKNGNCAISLKLLHERQKSLSRTQNEIASVNRKLEYAYTHTGRERHTAPVWVFRLFAFFFSFSLETRVFNFTLVYVNKTHGQISFFFFFSTMGGGGGGLHRCVLYTSGTAKKK